MQSFQSEFFVVPDGTTLHIKKSRVRHTEQHACILIHGSGDGAYVWDQLADSLGKQLHTIAIDLRGHGDSGWSSNKDYNIHTYTEDVARITDEVKHTSLIIVGHSLGADIAIRVAAMYACRLVGLVIVDFGPSPNPDGLAHARGNLKDSLRMYMSVNEYLDWLIKTRPLAPRPILEDLARKALKPNDSGGFQLRIDPAIADEENEYDTEADQNLWERLKNIVCPVLIIRGAGSAIIQRRTADRMVEVIPNALLKTIRLAGHAVMTDNPTEFSETVIDFVRCSLQKQQNKCLDVESASSGT